MITYNRSAFGWRLIFRIHGSAVYRSILPALVSVGFYFMFSKAYGDGTDDEQDTSHPYVIGTLVASTTFLLVFKLNHSYSRYWEAAGAVHHMMSKWMDATTHTSIYHLQCDHYRSIKPPSYFDYPQLNHLYMTRERERNVDYDVQFPEGSGGGGDKNDGISGRTGLRKRNGRGGGGRGGGRVSVSTVSPQIPHRQPFGSGPAISGGMMNGDSNDDGDDDNNDDDDVHITNNKNNKHVSSEGRIYSSGHRGDPRHSSAIHRDHTTMTERSHREIRSVAKSINYVESSTKRERAGGGGRMSSFPSRGGSGSEHFSGADVLGGTGSDGGESDDSIAESLFFASHLHQDEEDGDIPFNSVKDPTPLWGKPRLDGNWGEYYTKNPNHPLATYFDPTDPSKMSSKGFASVQGGRTAPLFLQELAHLSSLLVAVAMSTLRNDSDGSESPLGCYEPGAPWPEVDPAKDNFVQTDLLNCFGTFLSNFKTFLSIGKSAEEQTRFNAARPLPVIGGVSDAEIRFLQMARGPSAKTQLCWNWLSEFIIREHLAGSTGAVGPPIISRIIQFLGDGMIYYNHARKIMFVPFPFVHAQLSVLFIVVMIFYVPFLMDQYVSEPWLAATLTFFLILCLSGVNEVARELENPFRNVPNELPLVTFAAQYNEALYTMYAGYHPDFFWDGDRVMRNASHGSIDNYQGRKRRMDVQKECANERQATENGPETEKSKTTTRTARNVVSRPPSTTPDSKLMEDTTEPCDTSSSNTTSTIQAAEATARNQAENSNKGDGEEITALKKELEQQAKLIERLFAKVGNMDDLDVAECESK